MSDNDGRDLSTRYRLFFLFKLTLHTLSFEVDCHFQVTVSIYCIYIPLKLKPTSSLSSRSDSVGNQLIRQSVSFLFSPVMPDG